MAGETVKFEKALQKLEEIVSQLEGGELELEKSLKMFEEGIQMAQVCQSQLSGAEKKIEKLIKDQKGNLSTQQMETDSTSEQDELPF
ncbi:MAG: exodeoxyribonuclease VII small subunit [Nitrospinota bacterium]|nr:exodeoxyribonuclease VII small subunit [Nitrospinota bacterium]